MYDVLFKLSPPGIFGLPDGDRLVVPVETGKEVKIVGPVMDVRSGVLVSHGTLSAYRRPEEAIKLEHRVQGIKVSVSDNFLRISLNADTPDAVYEVATQLADSICQALAAQFGVRFSADYLSTQDAAGVPQRVRRIQEVRMLNATVYNLGELRTKLLDAIEWAAIADDRARKAFFYCEHACLLSEFAQTLRFKSAHATFSWALAFLQLFKALVVILGEPGTDRDYQSRARSLGLPADFWNTRVKELYNVRNDDDVAHYTLAMPEPGVMIGRFYQAAAVFRDALTAYMKQLDNRG